MPRGGGGKSKSIVTTFIDESEPRRRDILRRLGSAGLQTENVVGKFSGEEVKDLYSDSKILVNVHQTSYHDTFEELRVLPALLCGCIVVSENVPLKEYIPYHEYIVWADYDSIVDVVKDVEDNYESYFKKIFIDSGLNDVINQLTVKNKENIHKMISELKQRKKGRNQLKDIIRKFEKNFRKFIK